MLYYFFYIYYFVYLFIPYLLTLYSYRQSTENKIQMNLQRETQRETPMEPSEAERRLLEESRKAEEASVKSVQVANPLLFPTNPFARHHHQN